MVGARGPRTLKRELARGALGFGFVAALSGEAVAADGDVGASGSGRGPDRFEFRAQGETDAALFRRALLPGPNGAMVSTDTVAPVREYVRLHATDLDTTWSKDSLDVEFSGWASALIGTASPERPLDADVQVANVRYRQGPLTLRLGRQVVAGGAARFARFDGGAVTADLGAGFDVLAYGGLTVLPRWNLLPGYHYLGAAVESDLRNPSLLEAVDRTGYLVAGGRAGYRSGIASGGLSVHEAREHGDLSHLSLGGDARVELDRLSAGGSAIFELDARRVADARLFVDASPTAALDLSAEYLHSEPALLLSRQSVLAVFSTDSYDEVGGTALARATHGLSFEGSAFAEVYSSGRPGARGEAAVRLATDASRHSFLRVGYTRVVAPDNGYHSVRTSLVERLAERVSSTLEAYGYFYDESIRGVRTSMVYAGTISVRPVDSWSVLLGGSLARSPYALLDTQAQLRLVYGFDLGTSGRTR